MESEKEIKLEDLVGKHVFKGCEWHSGYGLFMLDGTTYKAVEDPDDGYRSYLDKVEITDERISSLLPHVEEVLCVMYGCLQCPSRNKEECACSVYPNYTLCDFYHTGCSYDCLVILDIHTKESILTIGTDYSDDYYPLCVFDYEPLNMACNSGERVKQVKAEFEEEKQNLQNQIDVWRDATFSEMQKADKRVRAINEECTKTHMKDAETKEKFENLQSYIYSSALASYHLATLDSYATTLDSRFLELRDIIIDCKLKDDFVYWLTYNRKIPSFLEKSKEELIKAFGEDGNGFIVCGENTPTVGEMPPVATDISTLYKKMKAWEKSSEEKNS